MGGKVSKARRACTTSKNVTYAVNGDASATSVGANVSVSKTYDTSCVQTLLGDK
jgi:hypothetical protein